MEEKEERVRAIALLYYSRKDVLDAIFKFSKNREISPRYFEGFGKRPDSFQYPMDILSFVKNGATSFHCSEELWEEPLRVSTELGKEQITELRTGWDLVIDIDCKWVDYSKKAAVAIIKSLEFSGVKNVGVKFSGSKGFHIIVPWKAFPEKIGDINAKEMFPEWPRAIVEYLKEISRPILEKMIINTDDDFAKVKGLTGIRCELCKNLSQERYQISVRCDNCYPPHIETFSSTEKKYKDKKCPVCKRIMEETTSKKFFYCTRCLINSLNNPENFNETILSTDIFQLLGLDILLVSSRHLFRMPYSLHEKTALASAVLDKNKIEEFQLTDADPLKVKIIDFIPDSEKNEAEKLLLQAIDWHKNNEMNRKEAGHSNYTNGYSENTEKNELREKIELSENEFTGENFPPVINNILKGMEDGKKRGVFILINFFRTLGMNLKDVEAKLNEWNKLNKPSLKQGYINAQISWHSKNKVVLPPNFDNEIYKEMGIYEMDQLSMKLKNPVNYVIAKVKSARKYRMKTKSAS